MNTDIFFPSILKQKAATERPFEVFSRFGEGRETVKKTRSSKKICPKCMLLVTSGVIWGDLGTFWNDFSDFRIQNHSVL